MKAQQFIFLVFAFLGATNYIAASVASSKNAVDSDKPILGVSSHDGERDCILSETSNVCTKCPKCPFVGVDQELGEHTVVFSNHTQRRLPPAPTPAATTLLATTQLAILLQAPPVRFVLGARLATAGSEDRLEMSAQS